MTLLSPSLLAKLERLQLGSRHRLAGKFGGDHRSTRYGNAIDFADSREYHPGDDYRRIDYHVLARLDQVLIKLYEADDEVVIRLLVDTSGSMAIGGKLRQAKRLAAAIGFVGLVNHDAVSLDTFPGPGAMRRFVGKAAAPALFASLDELEAAGPTPLAAATARVLERAGPPGITVVFSDLLTAQWNSLVGLRSRGSDLVVVHVLAEEDLHPPLAGDLELRDREDGSTVLVSVTAETLHAYTERAEQFRTDVGHRCRGVAAGYVAVNADDDIEQLLFRTWVASGVLR